MPGQPQTLRIIEVFPPDGQPITEADRQRVRDFEMALARIVVEWMDNRVQGVEVVSGNVSLPPE